MDDGEASNGVAGIRPEASPYRPLTLHSCSRVAVRVADLQVCRPQCTTHPLASFFPVLLLSIDLNCSFLAGLHCIYSCPV